MLRSAAVLIGALLLIGPHAAVAQTPASPPGIDDLVARNLQARGGLDKLKAVQTLKMTARLSSQGVDVAMTTYAGRPNKTRKEMAMGPEKMVFVFDGDTAWRINTLQGTPQAVDITGADLDAIKRESDFDSPFIDYKTRGYTIALVATETLGGRSVHHLKVTRAGTSLDCYLDAATGLEVRTVSAGPMGPLEQEFLDYRDVQGIQMPFTVRTLQNGVKVSEVKIESIQFNTPLDNALFSKPAR